MTASGEDQAPSGRRPGLPARAVLVAGLWAWSASAGAADLADVQDLLRIGRYEECERLAADEVARAPWRDPWHELKIRAQLARGEQAAAIASVEEALRRSPTSLALRLLGREVYRQAGRPDDAANLLDAIGAMVQVAPRRYDTPEGRVALGRYFLLKGADPKKVLDLFFDVALKQRPDFAEATLASAELALAKQDNALAAATLGKAPKGAADDPRFHHLLALAFSGDDRARSTREVAEALKINPRHVDSLLLRADHLVDDEKYAEAAEALDRALAVDPGEPRAWAYRAALAHLGNDPAGEASARESALERWATNPEVDHVIGRELSRKYRFAEGSAYQIRALGLDPGYAPARAQLCQDLLRLGDEAGGWKLAAEVFAADSYNVPAFNLATLRDRIAGFKTLEGDGFLVRMDPREADLYGPRVLALLARARKTLGERYGVAINEPVVVEIFPRKQEFAVRTFGLPGAEGFLGVCFGRVITAISPATQGETPANWEAVLWHEFCHAVTLAKTKNKMPRWLSEGISVYEEERQDPAWGGSLTPQFRAMILGDDLTPLSQLSSAFLAPKSGAHLQFAYHESALAVDFLVRKSGLEALKGLLDDLGAGATTDEALPRRTGTTLMELDREFATFARGRALAVAPGATWETPELPVDADSAAVGAWLKGHPDSFPGLRRLAARLVAEEKWPAAREVLERLKALYPDYVGEDNAYMLLATLHRRTNDPAAERADLEALAAREGSAGPAYLRLMELEEAAGDWKAVARDARRMLAVNPLVPAPYRQLARASEALGDRAEAVAALRALAILDDSDPAGLHFRLARLLKDTGQPAEARREVLKALEDAPRFLDAHRLLLELATPAEGALPR